MALDFFLNPWSSNRKPKSRAAVLGGHPTAQGAREARVGRRGACAARHTSVGTPSGARRGCLWRTAAGCGAGTAVSGGLTPSADPGPSGLQGPLLHKNGVKNGISQLRDVERNIV